MPKRLVIASDHGGIDLKNVIIQELRAKNIDIVDLGTHGASSVDYTDYAHALAEDVLSNEGMGVLICGTGIGMSLAANRHIGIRAALCTNSYMARMAREHNDANVLCMGGRVVGPGVALDMVEIFLNTEFEGDRHIRRINKIDVSPQ
ncbi:MAG: ribose 5-phosphate isomerase B [Deltaproteobacteria bacterium]|nr:ribose 5-phosphate isomerase B [Deltaproteobacteria bacterium]MBN2671317.1 ribose 5-phosphate isomerase B [Deltaproteobacteria bacterium]